MHRRHFMLSALSALPIGAAMASAPTARVGILTNGGAGHPVIDDKRTVKITGELERKVMGRVGFDVDRIDVLP